MLGPDGGLDFEPDGQAIELGRIALRSRQAEAAARP
jgi:hypothetical protein